MNACPTCAGDLPDGARFCPACGTALPAARAAVSERKDVTTLFVDVAGFTALTERADPEDVDASLRAFYDIARRTIERFGGVVEKFIGDAVVGVFGVPVVHEDDAERGVRAALDVVANMSAVPTVAGERLLVRAGVNTGPALVRPNVLPSSGEGMLVGDAVNTAARLLAAAEPGQVVVGEATQRLSSRAIRYDALSPLELKGKAEPVRAWRARGPIGRRGIVGGGAPLTPTVGREVELGILNGLFDKARASSSPHFALVVGEAGIGKSRLVQEFFRLVDERPGFLCTWRQGRCPPYGEGLAFWALREIVSAHAGIESDDSPRQIEEKLRQAVGVDADDDWLVSRLRPLVGLPAPQTDRDENFAAWVRLFEGIARFRPTVLVIEDLHWASAETVAFLSHLRRTAHDVPLLVITTLRPEFLEGRTDSSPESGRLTRLDVGALSRDESVRLAAALQGPSPRPGLAELVADRCGGNPLFAEELVRHEASGGDDAHAPDSIKVLLAARLDTLPAEQKALLADASVVGQAFAADLVAALGDRGDAEVELALKELTAREFVRPRQEAAQPGHGEYDFWHALTRDVAYEQLPRSLRARKHAAVGRWLETAAGPSSEDVSELLAYHYSTALDLARSAGEDALAEEMRSPTVESLSVAGERALALDVVTAERYFRRSVEEAPPDGEKRARLLVAWAEALTQCGSLPEARRAYEEGIAAYQAAGRPQRAAVAMMRLASALYWQDGHVATELREEATALLKGAQASPELAHVLEESAVQYSRDYDNERAVEAADEALTMSADLGLPIPIRALSYRGCSRVELGDEGGLADLRAADRHARQNGLGLDADIAGYLLADALFPIRGPRASLAARRNGLRYAKRRGNRLSTLWFEEGCVQDLFHCARWDEAEARIAELEPVLEAQGHALDLLEVRAPKALILLHRGHPDLAAPVAEWCVEQTQNSGIMFAMKTLLAAVRLAQQDQETALTLLRDVERESRTRRGAQNLAFALTLAVRTSALAGDEDLARRLVEEDPLGRALEAHTRVALQALLAERRGDPDTAEPHYAEAAARWRGFGTPWEEALALAGRGRCLLSLQRRDEAGPVLTRARAIFMRLDAKDELAALPSA
jgi:class 3 adenylate cyclase/tetratricopeptide (TPR) repeat protein